MGQPFSEAFINKQSKEKYFAILMQKQQLPTRNHINTETTSLYWPIIVKSTSTMTTGSKLDANPQKLTKGSLILTLQESDTAGIG